VQHRAIVHTHDPSIKYTYRRATTAEFATYWNANVANGGRPSLVAQSNLAIAVRETPDESTFAELLNAEWSSLPANVNSILLQAVGMFPLGDTVDDDYGELLDIRLMCGDVSHLLIEADPLSAFVDDGNGGTRRQTHREVALTLFRSPKANWRTWRNACDIQSNHKRETCRIQSHRNRVAVVDWRILLWSSA